MRGLRDPNSLALSPDGHTLYAGGRDSLAALARSDDGRLTPIGCVERTNTNQGCGSSAAGVGTNLEASVTPDGRDVYAFGSTTSTLAAFRRDGSSGALTPAGCIGQPGGGRCDVSAPGLDGGWRGDTAVTPDGRTVFAAAQVSGAVTAFTRDPDTGKLTAAGCVGGEQHQECAETAPGITSADVLALAPDGQTLYVASSGTSSIAAFTSHTAAAPSASRRASAARRRALAKRSRAARRRAARAARTAAT
jgi:DNA-binding beta-propeller fold protein YncE